MSKLGLRLLLTVTGWFIVLPALAQTDGRSAVHISITDPRPLAMAARALESRFGWVITYEDPQWLASSEIQDVTDSVSRDGSSFPRVLVPLGGSIEFDVSPTAPRSQGAERMGVVQNLVLAHTAAGNPGTFRVVQGTHGRLNIVPVGSKDASGRTVPQQPILDSKISIDERQWNGLAFLDAFTSQLGQVAGSRVVVGTVPLNIFANKVITCGAGYEVARDVLSRSLDQVSPRLSWKLFFDPGDKMYALNIELVSAQ